MNSTSTGIDLKPAGARPAWLEPIAATARFGRKVLRTLFFPQVFRMVERTGPVERIDEVVRLACRGFWGALSPIQNQVEFAEYLRRVKQLQPRCLLEIGTAQGGSLFAHTRVAAPDAHIISLDLPMGPGGGGYTEGRIPLYQKFALPGQKIDLVRDDSHSPAVHRKIEELLGGRSIDVLFIDGDHSYEGVKADYEMYGPLVRPGGLIAFHDTVYIGDVTRFWNEVKVGQDAEELTGPGRVFGIGLIRKR
ncbi:class I SAM-dependent methyltransferase [Aquisphaera insulae]|uniref:class I SAM-dependent methyltransferase n=1 Tax=Aquisphaera insulae TaxID=2712864 RepID=UPI0013EA02B9|nr:class I SAM-dependent methyltransferase [Aquisphaera insulae]